MPKRVAEVGEGNEEGSGVYGIVRDLIVEGKDARFVNKKGRFVVNWSRALDCFTDYKAKKNPQFKSKKICRRKASNGFRAALLNHYKKEGAKEFKESKKVNEKDEVVERQFQMPPRLFESLFRDVKITEDSEDDEQDSSSIASEVDIKAEVSSSSSASDTGFDEFMDLSLIDLSGNTEPSNFSFSGDLPTYPCLDAINTEEDNCLSDSAIPPPSQMFETSILDSALEEICSDGISDEISDEGMNLLGVVQDICPTSGSVKGGFQFQISLTEELPDDVKSGVAHFQGVAPVRVQKLNPYTLSGIVPPSEVPREVPVSVTTDAGQQLGMTCFRYVDEMREMVRQLVKDPTLQSLWFAIWSQEHGFFGTDSNISQVLGPMNMQDQDSSVQTKQQQSVKVLQLLVYTAAQTDAQQFLEMIFSTSAGQIVFNSYKDRTPLPEDIARANGHEDLAQFLQDINIRLSKETSINVQSDAIDWLELVKAVQNQSSISPDVSTKRLNPIENDDNSSDYFADAETSSCGSFDHDTRWSDISEDKGPRTKDIVSNQVPTKKPAISEQALSGEIPVKVSDNKKDKTSAASWGFTRVAKWLRSKWRKREDTSLVKQDACLDKKGQMESSTFQRLPGVTYLSGLFGKADASTETNVHGTSKPNTAKPKEYGQRNHTRSSKRSEAALKYKGIILTLALVTVLAGFKLSEGQILHWAVGNGYTRFSSILLQCGVYVDAPGLLRETPLHLAARNGFKDLVNVLVQSGGNVNSRNFPMQETPLHLATQNGHQHIAEFLIQRGSHVNARNFPMQETPLHLATRHGDQRIAEFLIQHGSQVNARNVPWQDTPLHLAAQNGRKLVAEVLIQHGGDLNARNNKKQVPLHLAAQNGHKHVAEVLIQHGSDVNAKSVPLEDTPLHLAAENGHKHVAEVLLQHGSDVSVRNNRRLMLNQLDVMTQLEMFLQHGFDTTVYIQNTPLHLAAENGHRQVAEVLISHGSDVNAKNSLGHGPLHLAAQHGCKCVAEVLIKHGSDVNSGWQTPLHLAALNGHKDMTEVLLKRGSDVNARSVQSQHTPLHFAAEKGQKQVAELLIQHGSNIIARDSLRHFIPLHLVAHNGHRQVAEVFIQHGGDVNARSRQENTPLHLASASGHKDIADLLIPHKSTPHRMAVENDHKETAEPPVTWNLLIDVSSEARLGSINRKRLKLGQSHSKRREMGLLYLLFTEEPLDHNTDEKRSHYSQSNDHDKASDTRCLHRQIRVPCGYNTDRSMHQLSAIGEADISSDSNVLNSTDRSVGEALSWHGLVSGFTENSAQDSINIEVMMDNEQLSSYDHQHHVKTLLLVAIVAMGLMMCLMLWYEYQLRVHFNHHIGGKKEGDFQINEDNFQCTVTQNRRKQASMRELRMERVRSWLACDLDQEEPLSVDGGGNTDDILNTGNHEANGEPDLQNQEQGHTAALSFNKGNVARADQHQDSNVPGSSTDNIDDNGSITASPETSQVKVSDECSSSSEEEFTTSGISEGDFVPIEEDTSWLPRTRLSTTAPYFTGCQKQSRGTPVPGLFKQKLKQSETHPTKRLSLVKQSAVNDEAVDDSFLDCIDFFVRNDSPVDEHLNKLEDGVQQSRVLDGFSKLHYVKRRRFANFMDGEGKNLVALGTRSGGARERKYKDVLFPKIVVLHKNDNECTLFSDMNKIESKSEIEFSSSMTQNDVQKKIQETFPYLEYKRFSCAALVKVDNDHKKFEFHGSQCVWDGKINKKQRKEGKSNLYILEEVVHPTSTVTLGSNSTGENVLLRFIKEDTRCIHTIADGMAQAGIAPLATKGYMAPESGSINVAPGSSYRRDRYWCKEDGSREERPVFLRASSVDEVSGQAPAIVCTFLSECFQVDELSVPPELSYNQKEINKNLAHVIRDFGDRLSNDTSLNSLISQVQVSKDTTFDTFLQVAGQIFSDGKVNWGRIATLFYFGYKLAVQVINEIPLIKMIIQWVVQFIKDRLAKWIFEQGGWERLHLLIRKYCRSRRRKRERLSTETRFHDH